MHNLYNMWYNIIINIRKYTLVWTNVCTNTQLAWIIVHLLSYLSKFNLNQFNVLLVIILLS